MFFKTILVLMLNLISMENINHINDLKWNHRVLIVKNNEEIDLSSKINLFKKEFDERDFIIIFTDGQSSFLNNRKMSNYFTRSVLKKIKNFNSSNYLFLIGKDGDLKNSYSSEIQIERIFSDVDKMPMRKFEVLKRIKKKS